MRGLSGSCTGARQNGGMRRSERVTAIGGAALLGVTALAVTGMLIVNGASAPAAASEDAPIPAELIWLGFSACQPPLAQDYGLTLEQEETGRVWVRAVDYDGGSVEDPQTVAEVDEFNGCLAAWRFERFDAARGPWSDATTTERLLLADAFYRHTLPCLSAQGYELPLSELGWFRTDRTPWLDIYYYVAPVSGRVSRELFDEALAARRACGTPADILAPAGSG